MGVKNSVKTMSRPETVTGEVVKEPGRFKVVMLNDDVTTMEFVVQLLCNVFNKPLHEAIAIMYRVHNNGKAICGVYTQEIAEAKVSRVRSEATHAGFPLKCVLEQD